MFYKKSSYLLLCTALVVSIKIQSSDITAQQLVDKWNRLQQSQRYTQQACNICFYTTMHTAECLKNSIIASLLVHNLSQRIGNDVLQTRPDIYESPFFLHPIITPLHYFYCLSCLHQTDKTCTFEFRIKPTVCREGQKSIERDLIRQKYGLPAIEKITGPNHPLLERLASPKMD